MIDFDAPVDARTHPYRWALAQNLVPGEARHRLRDELPALTEFARFERKSGGDKTYGMYVLPLLSRGEELPALDQLGPAWREFVTRVQGAEYRAWVRDAVGCDTRTCPMDVGVFVFGPGDGVSPHTDRSDKYATHVFYLNERWPAEDGGHFLVHGKPADGTPVEATVVPGEGRSVLFATAADSWHAVGPIRREAARYRFTVQVEMWR
ncbi:2OG-Fe(II) oxygenase [Streptomyces sp. NPDC101455]|uniref:2OG-Fe(II) oxygenase n=1 Tax=Streptomyces sp. NPDC101455 TaxID=3366142 RepID=UPI00381692A6